MEFAGKVVNADASGKWGFIGIGTVRRTDGGPHNLGPQDVFLHRDDLGKDVVEGMTVSFDASPDRHRGGNTFRATEACELYEGELLPVGTAAVPGFNMTALAQDTGYAVAMSLERLPVHAAMKSVPLETVDRVIANAPLPRTSRVHQAPQTEEEREQLLAWMLGMMFPALRDFRADFKILDWSDAELDREVEETARNYRTIGLTAQVEILTKEVARFKTVRGVFKMVVEEGLVRPDSIIPTKYLPDLFMAVPVWYFFTNKPETVEFTQKWGEDDPHVSPRVKHFCNLFKDQRWFDTFQLFNRRVRPLSLYTGEMIPPVVLRRMMRVVGLLDHVVIATPYHDVAGKEWSDPEWQRAIDPYVLGFKEGLPFFFVLARFSDAGTFPLFNELVADTIEFLRANMERLKRCKISSPYWYQASQNPYSDEYDPRGGRSPGFGEMTLYPHVNEILAAFERGELFSWLRGEIPASAAQKA